MTDLTLPMDGGCRCGAVRLRISAPPVMASACHCTGCQSMTASAFSLTLTIPETGFGVTQGDTVIGGLHGAIRHAFCADCKSWLFTRADEIAGLVNLRASVLDDHSWFVPFVEVWTSEKLPWAATPATHSFATQPPPEAFPALLADYAARSGNRS